jgi:hypothetical protein
VLAAAVGGLVALALARTGELVFPLDDPYIHMAIARSLVERGAWAVTGDDFCSCSSSPAWTLLLAGAYRVAGVADWTPLWLNLAAGFAAVAAAERALRRAGASPALRFAGATAAALAAPLPVLALTGMEHGLHAALTIGFLAAFGHAATGRGPRALVPAALLAAALTATRYEGAFAVASACAWLLWQRRALAAAALAAAGAAPPGAYAAVSLAHGWFAVPTSVLLKSDLFTDGTALQAISAFLARGPRFLLAAPHVGALLAALALALAALRRSDVEPRAHGQVRAALWVLLGATLLHVQLAKWGYLFRYEAYLVAAGVVGLLQAWTLLRRAGPSRRLATAGLLAAALLASLLLQRAALATAQAPQAAKNIHEQQHQMALFVQRYRPAASVALNDIGFVSYLADVELLDLAGLATLEVARERLAGTLDARDVERLARERDVELAIVYERWFVGMLPAHWVPVARWGIVGNVVAGSTAVSFFATSPARARELEHQLREFEPSLPRDVRVVYWDRPGDR